ncbi:MAG: hypothetical protein WD872_01500 [Pirellulaceae bacterium]
MMIKFRNVPWGLGLCLLGGLLSGCTEASSGTVDVTGKVTKGGQPVSGAAVTFVPTAAGGKAAAGTTDEAGIYKLTTFVNGDGAMPGSYKVMITKFPGAAPLASGIEASKEATPEDMDAIYKSMEKQGKNIFGPETRDQGAAPQNELAAQFANAETSGLTAEVKDGAALTFDFEVN